MKEIRIGAIIPTFNRKESLKKCLQCLQSQVQGEKPWFLAIIVVVDGSTDGTLHMLENEFPEVQIVQGDGNWWYTKSINEGIKKAQTLDCNFVLTLNDDLTFGPDYIGTILGDQLAGGENSIIGSVSLSSGEPRLITFSGVEKIDFLLKEYNYLPKFSRIEETEISGVKPSVVLSGRGILYPMEIFHRWGLYDEKLVQYSSETDFTYNASKQGYKVMISYNAKVYENVKLTSSGAVYNNPTVGSLFKSFKNKYSINSLRKIHYYSVKHRGVVSGWLISGFRVMGIIKNFVKVKVKNKA
ncbi:MAG: glycosyltransferase family 2 protein [Chitinophagaceae bacterium]|nr:glycosyltransferase family 2 protein [Chitinophagaceae bacterium]